jgi:subtilisin family serine protease
MAKIQKSERTKLFPKLRMIANGSTSVNMLRAERAPAVGVVVDAQVLQNTPQQRETDARAITKQSLATAPKRGSLREPVSDVRASVFLELANDATVDDLPKTVQLHRPHEKGQLVTAEIALSELQILAESPAVNRIEMGEGINFSPPQNTHTSTRPSKAVRKVGDGRAHHFGGGVLVGIIDVQGFDFSHSDFVDEEGATRFARIWDQGGSTRPSPQTFDYGSEIRQEHMNAAITASSDQNNPDRLAAYLLEPQSQMAHASHGTHVASIAAGNRGLCRQAILAGVLISLPDEDVDRRKSFYDSTRIAHAVEYLLNLAAELGEDGQPLPVSINISLGTNGHAHDASSVVSRWIDYALSHPGRAVTVAAGNAGQQDAVEPGDLGFIMGRIHSSGRIPNAHLTRNLEWIVMGDGIADLSENELEIWYSPQDRFAVEVIPPGGVAIGPVEPGEYIENQELPSGTFVSIYNEIYSPANGDNHIAIYLSPFFSQQGVIGVQPGQWIVRIHSREVRNGNYQAWIERDDPRRLGSLGMQQAWSFPSFFSGSSNVDESSVSSLACGQRIVSVANLDDEAGTIDVTSSQGPTRDGRNKPEICAPGTDISAALGFGGPDEWVNMTGTSMASPYVAGVAGLMLAVEPRLTAAQITGIIRRTAVPLAGHDFNWRNDAGFGRVNAETCLLEAARAYATMDKTP